MLHLLRLPSRLTTTERDDHLRLYFVTQLPFRLTYDFRTLSRGLGFRLRQYPQPHNVFLPGLLTAPECCVYIVLPTSILGWIPPSLPKWLLFLKHLLLSCLYILHLLQALPLSPLHSENLNDHGKKFYLSFLDTKYFLNILDFQIRIKNDHPLDFSPSVSPHPGRRGPTLLRWA